VVYEIGKLIIQPTGTSSYINSA